MTNAEFRGWRERLDITQRRAAELLGRSERQVQAYENVEGSIPVVVELATAELERRVNG